MRLAGKPEKIFCMAQSGHKLVRALRDAIRQLTAIAECLEADDESEIRIPIAISEAVQEKMGRRECLQCARQVAQDQSYRRGLCSKDYRKTQLEVKAGKATLAALMVAGLLGPKGPGGRTSTERTALDEFLAKATAITDAQMEVADQMAEEALKQTRPAKKAAKK